MSLPQAGPPRGDMGDILAFFGSGRTVLVLSVLASAGLLLSLAEPRLLPPVVFLAGLWYTRLLWLLLAFSWGTFALRGLRRAAFNTAQRGLRWTLLRATTSIRLAIVLIALFVLLGLISTIVPQFSLNRQVDLLARYGPENFRTLRRLGFFTLFSNWYAYALVGLFAVNLSACTCKRLRASLSYFNAPMRPKRLEALGRMAHTARLALYTGEAEAMRERARRALRARHYRVQEVEGQLLAEKWRWERFAIDLFHLSLLVVIGALLVTNTLGYDLLQVHYKGDLFQVPGRSFSVRVDDFRSENYPGTEQVMDWKTHLTVLQDGREVKSGSLEVNQPLSYQGVSFYQSAMGEDWQGAAQVTFRVIRTRDGSDLGEFKVKVGQSFSLPGEGIIVKFNAFLPDFALVNGIAYSKDQYLLNPAASLEVDNQEGKRLFRTWSFSQLPRLQQVVSNSYRFYITGMTAPEFTGLEISWDPGMPVAYLGFTLMVAMLLLNLLFKHRQIWVASDETAGALLIGAKARKGDLEDEFEGLMKRLAVHSRAAPSQTPAAQPSEAHSQPQI